MRTIKSYAKAVGRKLGYVDKHAQDLRYLPNPLVASDVFLVSYPKSGNTWLRYMLSAYLARRLALPCNSNWFTIQELIPDVEVGRNIPYPNQLAEALGYRIIKSHGKFNPEYKRVVLLVRNPEDALASCYRYFKLNKVIAESMSFMRFLEEHPMGLAGWKSHTNGWIGTYKIGRIVRAYRFEDLKNKPAMTLGAIVDLLGFPYDDEDIEFALKASSKAAMSISESKHRSTAALLSQNERFVGEGRIGGHDVVTGPSELDFIKKNTEMERALIQKLVIDSEDSL